MRQAVVLNDANEIIGVVMVTNDIDITIQQGHEEETFIVVPEDHVLIKTTDGWDVEPVVEESPAISKEEFQGP